MVGPICCSIFKLDAIHPSFVFATWLAKVCNIAGVNIGGREGLVCVEQT